MTLLSQPGIFNALDSTFAGGMSPAYIDGTLNALALQAAIDAAQASGNPSGAIVLIPSFGLGDEPYGAYQIACRGTQTSAVNIPNTGGATPILICGTGAGTELVMLSGDGFTLFGVESDSVSFQDLTIHYDLDDTHAKGTAFNFSTASGSGPANCSLFHEGASDMFRLLHQAAFRGRPPFRPFLRAAARFAADRTAPPRRPISLIQRLLPKTPFSKLARPWSTSSASQ